MSLCSHPPLTANDVYVSVSLFVSHYKCPFCPSHQFRFGAIQIPCAHYSCRLIPCDKLFPALPLLSDRKLPCRPLAGDAALPRTLGNEWATVGRESRLGLRSPPPPYYYHHTSSTTTITQSWVNMSPSCDFYTQPLPLLSQIQPKLRASPYSSCFPQLFKTTA